MADDERKQTAPDGRGTARGLQSTLDGWDDTGAWSTSPGARRATGGIVGPLYRYQLLRDHLRRLQDGKIPMMLGGPRGEDNAGDVVTTQAPAPSWPWLRSGITSAQQFLARGGWVSGRQGRTSAPRPVAEPTTAAQAAGSFGSHVLNTAVGMAVGAPLQAAEKALNWYDFARTGYAGFIRPQEMLAPSGAGVAGYLTAASRPGTLGVFGGDIGARNLAKAGRPTAQAALELARQMEEKGFSQLEIRYATNDLIERHDPMLGGVHKGAEGMWRFEISDAGLTRKEHAFWDGKGSARLAEIIEHPEFFAAYPQMRSVEVTNIKGDSSFWQSHPGPLKWAIGPGQIGIGRAGADRTLHLLHEAGAHGVQTIEGFARGSSAAEMQQIARREYPQERPLDFDDALEAYRRVGGEVEARNVESRHRLTGGGRRAKYPLLTEDVSRTQQFVLKGDRLERAMQLGPSAAPPSLKLVQLRRMMAPNKSIETFAYDMVDASGKSIGKLTGSYFPAEKALKINMIQMRDPEGKFAHLMQADDVAGWVPATVSANMLSKTQVRDLAREMKRLFPERTETIGIRQTGVRGTRGEGVGDVHTDAEGMTRVPMKGSLKASTGIPSLQAPPGSGMSIPDEQNFRFQQEEREKLRETDPDSRFNDYLSGRSYEGMSDPFMHLQDSLEGRLPWRGNVDPVTRDHLRRYFDMRRDLNRVPGPTSEREITLVADAHVGRSAIRRVTVESVDDSGPLQMLTVRGVDGETYTAPMGGMFGLSSSPPVGSVGYAFMGNGRPDQAFLLGVEDPTLRPRNQADGEVRLYAKEGQFIGMGANGDLVISAPGQVHP